MFLDNIKSVVYKLYLIYLYVKGKVKTYHKGREKRPFAMVRELMYWWFTEGCFNRMYYAFGLNLSDRKQREYIGRKEFLAIKNLSERKLKEDADCESFNYDIITKDKFYANSIFAANNINCIKNEALVSNNSLITAKGEYQDLHKLLDFDKTFILKNTVLEAGDGILFCENEAGKLKVNGQDQTIEELASKLANGKWVLQYVHRSHRDIAKINATALNTTRIVTILNNQEPVYLTGFQSFATNNEKTDSWNKGSIYVGINVEKGVLKKEGYYHPDLDGKATVDSHPDSNISFENYPISELHNAVELCKKTHKLLYFNFIIGWDVAITEDGPMILEANEKPGMNAVQCVDGGLRNTIKEYFNKTYSK